MKLFKQKAPIGVDEKAAEIYSLIVQLAEQGVKQANDLQALSKELLACKIQIFDLRNMIEAEKVAAYHSGYQQAIAEASIDNSILVDTKK